MLFSFCFGRWRRSYKEGVPAKRSFAGKRSSRGAYPKAAARRLCHAAKRAATRPCSATNREAPWCFSFFVCFTDVMQAWQVMRLASVARWASPATAASGRKREQGMAQRSKKASRRTARRLFREPQEGRSHNLEAGRFKFFLRNQKETASKRTLFSFCYDVSIASKKSQ